MKQWSYLSLLLILLASVLPVNAQSPWFVYFYDSETASLNYVTADGQSQLFSLGLGENDMAVTVRSLAFAHSQQELAYCVLVADTGQPISGNTRLVIRDIPNEQNHLEIELGFSDYCYAGVYDSSDSMIALGLLRQFGDAYVNWEILILDANTGEILHSLDASFPDAEEMITAYGFRGDLFVPDVFSIEGEQIIFEAKPVGGRELPFVFELQGLAYSWNMTSQELSLREHWGYSYNRFGNEQVWVTNLEEYPSALRMGATEPLNAVMYVDSTGTESVIYYTGDWGVTQSVFINGGREIAVYLEPGYGAAGTMPNPKWIVIDRSGNVRDLMDTFVSIGDTVYFVEILPNPNGYGVLESSFADHSYRLSLVQNGARDLIWEQLNGNNWSLTYTPEIPWQEFPAFPAFDLSAVPR